MKLKHFWIWSALIQICIYRIIEGNIFVRPLCIYANDECPNEHISFWLYKNGTHNDPVQLDPITFPLQLFEPKLPLKILIHGFTGHRNASPNLEIRPVLLQTQEVFVISVDYATLAPLPCYYPWAVQNVRVVAKCLALLIDNLIYSGLYSREDIHVIGFSLGAQVAGLTANYAENRLMRITGLDPARPAFTTYNLTEKLDASDADFVDVIHTDAFFYALLAPCGHVDFYPNIESFNQAGCSYWQDGRLRNCNHYRAPLYYAESIVTKKGFWAYNCGDWIEFFLKHCSDYAHRPDTTMGYFVSEEAYGSYFLTTHMMSPFAKGPLIDFELDVYEGS